MELPGNYLVIFKGPYEMEKPLYSFTGKCENFNPTGLCAFFNKDRGMLLVMYKDIIQMRLV